VRKKVTAIGANGLDKVYGLKPAAEEQAALNKSAAAVKELVEILQTKMGAEAKPVPSR
jgi:malate/lactate dehydrogenase